MNNNIYNCFLTYLSDNSHALDRGGNNYYIMLRYSLNCDLQLYRERLLKYDLFALTLGSPNCKFMLIIFGLFK